MDRLGMVGTNRGRKDQFRPGRPVCFRTGEHDRDMCGSHDVVEVSGEFDWISRCPCWLGLPNRNGLDLPSLNIAQNFEALDQRCILGSELGYFHLEVRNLLALMFHDCLLGSQSTLPLP